jgi:hypothetical protein
MRGEGRRGEVPATGAKTARREGEIIVSRSSGHIISVFGVDIWGG